MTTDTRVQRRALAMHTLMIDAAAAEAYTLLADRRIPAILLKGRVLATWLYAGEDRHYGDVDLLVSPADRDRAVTVLAELGYRHWLEGAARSEYGPNELELIRPQGPCIDLHHVLLGVQGDAQRCWDVLVARTETMRVASRMVTTLDATARAMHLALHCAQDGHSKPKTLRDMELGLAALSVEDWAAAAGLAETIGALEAFSAGLRIVDDGRRVAETIGLGRPHDIGLLLRAASAPHESLQIEHFVRAGTTRARMRLVARKLWPTKAYMVGREPGAARGPVSLQLARARRLAGLPPRFLAAVRSWRAASRESRSVDVDAPPLTKGAVR